jgi:hypothetical protein
MLNTSNFSIIGKNNQKIKTNWFSIIKISTNGSKLTSKKTFPKQFLQLMTFSTLKNE